MEQVNIEKLSFFVSRRDAEAAEVVFIILNPSAFSAPLREITLATDKSTGNELSLVVEQPTGIGSVQAADTTHGRCL